MCLRGDKRMIKQRLIGTDPFSSEPIYESIPEKVVIICSVRKATPEYKKRLEEYVAKLEKAGIEVYLPHRDNNQEDLGINICFRMREKIRKCDRVDIFYSGSEGTLFDMGMAFMASYGEGKPIKIIENLPFDDYKKSFPKMLQEWSNKQDILWGI